MVAYTLKRDEHVRVDLLAHRLGEHGLAWLDLVGTTMRGPTYGLVRERC